jgi:molybdopterin-guanine dinucleotide biosynthesis protein A
MGELRIISFFPSVNVKYITLEERDLKEERHMFFNINTEGDYLKALQMMAEEDRCDNVQ